MQPPLTEACSPCMEHVSVSMLASGRVTYEKMNFQLGSQIQNARQILQFRSKEPPRYPRDTWRSFIKTRNNFLGEPDTKNYLCALEDSKKFFGGSASEIPELVPNQP